MKVLLSRLSRVLLPNLADGGEQQGEQLGMEHSQCRHEVSEVGDEHRADEPAGDYDILSATDVFEHVLDPIGLAAITAAPLRIGGKYLIASGFQPTTLCHLPQLFHLQLTWEPAMQSMGLESGEKVQYGRAFRRQGALDPAAAWRVGDFGRTLYPFVKRLPVGKQLIRRALAAWLCR